SLANWRARSIAIATWSATAAMKSRSDAPNTRSTMVATVSIPTVLPRTRSCARSAFHSRPEMRSTCDPALPTADAEAFTWGPALRDGDDLVVVRLALDRPRKQLDRRAPVDGEHIDQQLERQSLRGPQPAVVSRSLLEVRPRQIDVCAQHGEHHVDEAGRGRDE